MAEPAPRPRPGARRAAEGVLALLLGLLFIAAVFFATVLLMQSGIVPPP